MSKRRGRAGGVEFGDDPVNVLRAARKSLAQARKGYQLQKREEIASAYGAYIRLHDDSDARARFFKEPDFQGRRMKDDREALLRYVMCFVAGGLEGRPYDRGCTYARAIWPFAERNASEEEVRKSLKLGIEKLHERAASKKRLSGKKVASGSGAAQPNHQFDENTEEPVNAAGRGPSVLDELLAVLKEQRALPSYLIVSVEPSASSEVLALRSDEVAILRVRRTLLHNGSSDVFVESYRIRGRDEAA